jgi:hypothetical protein
MGKIDHFSGFCAEADKQNADHSALEQMNKLTANSTSSSPTSDRFGKVAGSHASNSGSTLQARSSSNSVTASSHSSWRKGEATNSGSVAKQS